MSVGQDIPRVDGQAKLLGQTQYVDDLEIEGVLHGGTFRSPVARGKIKKIHFAPDIPWNEYTIVDYRDIPGRNEVLLIEKDQPALAEKEVRHKHEPILLIAHRSISALRRALRSISVEIEPLPAVFDPHLELSPDLIQYGPDNVFKRIDILKGSPDSFFPLAAHVIEGAYQTGSQEHVYLETQGMLAYREGSQMVIRGSMQCPYFVLHALTHLFNRAQDAFRVIQMPTGGAFGGKEDYPSIIAIHAALLADKAQAPVKIIYDRQEDMAATTKRHPSWVRHRTAVDSDGKLLAMEIQITLDGGAYVTLSPVVLSRGAIHAAGPYHCEHIRIHGEVRLTNSPPYGAFRGFGAPQTLFAVERHMDVIADRLGMEPAELRAKNLLHEGQTTATQQVMKDRVDLPALMNRALDLASYESKRKQYADENKILPYLRRGIGFSTFYHGAGFTGSGETNLASEVWVEGLPDGQVEILTANTEMGQGTETILSQIVADRLGLGTGQVVVIPPDISRVPNSGPTVASRTVMVIGKLLEQACDDLMRIVHADGQNVQQAILSWHAANLDKRLLGKAKYQTPVHIHWDEDNYRGDAYSCYSWAVHVADVEVDLRTYCVRVSDFVALQEVGKVINPTLAAGQIQGGVAQGIGWALMEEVVAEEGVMVNNQMTNYLIPTSNDLPSIRVFFEEQPSQFGPHGAKGIGELPMDGPAPAVINAVCHALGTSIDRIPLAPERLMEHMEAADGG